MTTYLERGQIRDYRNQNPFAAGYTAPSDVNTAFVTGAVDFSRRITSALEDIAHDKITAAAVDYPNNLPAAATKAREQLLMSLKIQAGALNAEPMALREILAEFDSATPATLDIITEGQMKTYLLSIWPVLAEFYHRPSKTRT